MEYNYVYRSNLSELSAVGDVAILSEDIFVVAFASGLVEVVDTDKRCVTTSFLWDSGSAGVNGVATVGPVAPGTGEDGLGLLLQSKSGLVAFYRWSAASAWENKWTITMKNVITFSKPVLASLANYDVAVFVSEGQNTLAFVNVETGQVDETICVSERFPECKGMVVAICMHANSAGRVLVMMESGHVVEFALIAENAFQVTCSILTVVHPLTPSPPEVSCVITAFTLAKDGKWLVGYSNGFVDLINNDSCGKSKTVLSRDNIGGIGDICVSSSGLILVGTWKGKLITSRNVFTDESPLEWTEVGHSPHRMSVVRVASNKESTRAIAASVDGRVSVWDLL